MTVILVYKVKRLDKRYLSKISALMFYEFSLDLLPKKPTPEVVNSGNSAVSISPMLPFSIFLISSSKSGFSKLVSWHNLAS